MDPLAIIVTCICWIVIVRWGIPDEGELGPCEHSRLRWDQERQCMVCTSCRQPLAVEDVDAGE